MHGPTIENKRYQLNKGDTMGLSLKPLNCDRPSLLLTEYNTLGRARDCSFFHSDNSLSDRHARIERRDQTFFIKDLRSNSGTFVNEVRVLEAELRAGQKIQVGNLEFLVIENEPVVSHTSKLSSKNPYWAKTLSSLENISQTEFPVLLLGPSGTGKDILAHEIHRLSSRNKGELISVNCSALTETLVESELFGHVKGSFTGAVADRKGAFESARGGTLFLDEIGDLPYSLQAKLLRALENNEIRPVGSDRTIKTNIRIIAATHQNLEEKIQIGQFRSDLFYRLNVIQLRPPAIRDRIEDFETLLIQFAKEYRVRFSIPAIVRLKKHDWPGNIREIKNLVARARALFPHEYIELDHVEQLLGKQIGEIPLINNVSPSPQLPVIKELEKQMIIKRLAANRGNQRLTAYDLGMPKSTLHDRLKYYDINVKTYKI